LVSNLEELIDKTKELKKRALFGIGFAQILKNI